MLETEIGRARRNTGGRVFEWSVLHAMRLQDFLNEHRPYIQPVPGTFKENGLLVSCLVKAPESTALFGWIHEAGFDATRVGRVELSAGPAEWWLLRALKKGNSEPDAGRIARATYEH